MSTNSSAPVMLPTVSEEACPVEVVTFPTEAGRTTVAAVRRPPWSGPWPALIHLHGGLTRMPTGRLVQEVTGGPTQNRFLAAGYVVVEPTFADRNVDPLSDEALRDCLAVIAHVRRLPGVDGRSVVLWGDSGGGSLALELAGQTDLAAVATQEPASVLLTGMYSPENLGGAPPYNAQSGQHIMADPQRYYTPDVQERTRAKLANIRCPVFIAQGDVHSINRVNNEIVVPELRRLGKDVTVTLYPGQRHGFSRRPDSPAAEAFFRDCHTFFLRHLPTPPEPIDPALVTAVAASSAALGVAD